MPEPAEGGRVRLCKQQALKNASEDQVRTHEARVIRSPLQSKWFSRRVDRRPLSGRETFASISIPGRCISGKNNKERDTSKNLILRIDLQTSSSALTILFDISLVQPLL